MRASHLATTFGLAAFAGLLAAVSATAANAGPIGSSAQVAKAPGEAGVVLVHDSFDSDWDDRPHRHYRRHRGTTYVDAPFTRVRTKGSRVAVDAPFTSVRVSRYGVWVRAPFVNRYFAR